jgi:hypothetical protein
MDHRTQERPEVSVDDLDAAGLRVLICAQFLVDACMDHPDFANLYVELLGLYARQLRDLTAAMVAA